MVYFRSKHKMRLRKGTYLQTSAIARVTEKVRKETRGHPQTIATGPTMKGSRCFRGFSLQMVQEHSFSIYAHYICSNARYAKWDLEISEGIPVLRHQRRQM